MKKIGKMKISKRLSSVFMILVVLMFVSSAFAVISFQIIGSNMKTFYNVQYETTKNQMEIRKDVQTINKRILWAIICNDAEVVQEQKGEFETRFNKIDEYINIIGNNLKSNDISGELSTAFNDFEVDTYEIINLVEDGDIQGAINYYETTFNDVSEVLANALDNTGNLSDAAAEHKYKNSIVVQIVITVFLVILTFGSLGVAIILAKRITKSIVAPLSEIQVGTEEIAKGELHTIIKYSGDDEIGQVADSLRASMNTIKTYITDIDRVMKEMADGNFDITFTNEFIGDFKSIQTSLEYFTTHISLNILEIGKVSEQVSSGSMQIAEAAQTLAEGATDQAGIVEELSATVSNITQRITDNAKNAVEISKEVEEVTQGILQGNDRMKEVVTAMETINTTSREIGNIIETINSIAEQTNLLSLNASIEAARAGVAGRGFAVVADQVSLLASQSAEAANTSTKLIEASLKAVDEGKVVADIAANELNKVVNNASTITEKVDSIAEASSEQADAVKQIDIGIEQIAQVVETNAATAEESSASSEELTSEAQSLKDLIYQFTLKK